MEGLKKKYSITKADGRPVDDKGVYFVLKPNSKDLAHARASRRALKAYADFMASSNPVLGNDLYHLADACREAEAGNVEPLEEMWFPI